MSLLLTLERAPQPQPVRQMRLETGGLVIGRAAEADWRIDDPDMYVSRAHCTVEAGPTGFTVTDTSSGGLFLDGSPTPLGPGNKAPLRDGMRLRLGDYVLRVEIATEAAAGPALSPTATTPQAAAHPFNSDDFFSTRLDPPQEPPRPANLPDPFDRPVSTPRIEEVRSRPPLFDDPFTLDPVPTPPPEPGNFGSFEWDPPAAPPENPAENKPAPDSGFVPPALPERPDQPQLTPCPHPTAAGSERPVRPEAARDAFLRGLGLEPSDFQHADMEALGRDYRLMIEGLMHLLRKRAEEKAGARIVQTVVAGSEVNPLKFMPTADDALSTMLGQRSRGFLDAEAAISGAIRDLAQHHVSAWRGVQGALSRMLDRFDPKALEAELKELSRIETLLAGGRRAKLWELYEERYREIARSAESRFLGEIGADFRDAYEERGN